MKASALLLRPRNCTGKGRVSGRGAMVKLPGKRIRLSGKRIRKARIAEGLSQIELASKIGVSQKTVSNWEHDSARPKAIQIENLQNVLGLLTGAAVQQPTTGAFGAWLRRIRSEKNLSVAELATKSSVSIVSIYNIEAGKSQNPHEETRKRLEEALSTKVPDDVQQEIAEEQQVEGLSALTDFDPHDVDSRPKRPGVYVFYDVSDRPIYVGKSQDISKRVAEHEDKFWFKYPIVSNAAYVEVKDAKLRHQVEQVLIRFLKSNAIVNKQSVVA
jgi:transcriptional regulator with XRE-family HTH domain